MRSVGSKLIAAALALRAPLRAPLIPRAAVGAREGWRESDTSTVFGRARSPATDARDGGDDYVTLDMDVIDVSWMDNNVHALRHSFFNVCRAAGLEP